MHSLGSRPNAWTVVGRFTSLELPAQRGGCWGLAHSPSAQSPCVRVYTANKRLSSIGDVIGRWKEYFEDPNITCSDEEAETEDSEGDSLITQAEVTEVVTKLLGGRAQGVDENRPEYFQSLDVVGLSWRTHLSHRVAVRDSPSVKEEGPESVFQLQGDDSPQPPG